jgi:hypothetical protein
MTGNQHDDAWDFETMKKISRAHFLKTLLAGLVVLPGAAALGGVNDKLRGDVVGWARLKTNSPVWERHSRSDPELMRFFQEQTTLNIDPKWFAAGVENLGEMCKYPLLFSQSIQMVRDESGRSNLAEYMRRGGFLLVDACCNHNYNPDFNVFLHDHIEALGVILPEAKVQALPSDHDIYRCHFQIPNGHPPHTFDGNIYNPNKARLGLHGVTIGARMAGIVSMSGLQCGWDHMIAPAGHDVACMRMLVNIYIYAMMQGA